MNTSSFRSFGLLLFRVVISASMLTHGSSKAIKLLNGDFSFANPIGIGELPTLILAVIAEVIAPIFIIVGYKTRLATIPAIATMFVAAFIVHLNDGFGKQELSVIYLVSFLLISILGPGKISIDKS
ncbi:MAG: DoxX family protein [Flavobacteriaceae bacterium]|jgi:putative oxidoreductase|nr:DoxX family protein [Flavobacteriaceae bacterium]NVJ72634.1 DoxX family protein [Flavobacteriaceae bacterium]